VVSVSKRVATAVVSIAVCGLVPVPLAAGEARLAAQPVTPSGWRIAPVGDSITVDGPGLVGPWVSRCRPTGRMR
jgi:hypothetical protein